MQRRTKDRTSNYVRCNGQTNLLAVVNVARHAPAHLARVPELQEAGQDVPDLCLLAVDEFGHISRAGWALLDQMVARAAATRRHDYSTGVDGSQPRFGIFCSRHGSDALHLPCAQVLTDLLSGV